MDRLLSGNGSLSGIVASQIVHNFRFPVVSVVVGRQIGGIFVRRHVDSGGENYEFHVIGAISGCDSQHQMRRGIQMVLLTGDDGDEVVQIESVGGIISLPRVHIEGGVSLFSDVESVLFFRVYLVHLVEIYLVHVRHGSFEIFGIGETVGSDGSSVGESVRTIIFEFRDDSVGVGGVGFQVDLKFDVFSQNSDRSGLQLQYSALSDDFQVSYGRLEQHFSVDVVENQMFVLHRFVERILVVQHVFIFHHRSQPFQKMSRLTRNLYGLDF